MKKAVKYLESEYEYAHNYLMSAFDEVRIKKGFTRNEVENLATIVNELRGKKWPYIDIWSSNRVLDYTCNLVDSYLYNLPFHHS